MDAKLEFADLKFKVECSSMVLTKAGGSPLVVKGPGEIWQNSEGILQFKIFTDQAGYRCLQDYRARPGIVGQLIPDEDFFTLEAREYGMAEWTARRIIPSYRGGFDEGMACGYLRELVRTQETTPNSEQAFVLLRLKGKILFPYNSESQAEVRVGGQLRRVESALNTTVIEDGDYRFELFHEQEHTAISLLLPSGDLTDATPSRIREALQFVLGRELAVMVVETSTGDQCISRLTSPAKALGIMPPPLEFGQFAEDDQVWHLFTTYFRHIHSRAGLGWHPISRHIESAVASTASSRDAEVLALAVAVEGLVGECFPKLAPASAEFLPELDKIEAALAAVEVSAQTRNRMQGTIGQLRKPRNSDLLCAFIKHNHLPGGLLKSWSSLRNTSAHGGGLGDRDIETVLRLRNEVRSLLYSIVFAAINYNGSRTDYSLPGFPICAWPIQPTPEPSPVTTAKILPATPGMNKP